MQISDAEWIVMNLIWERPSLEANFVIDHLAKDNGWTAATVKTMLHRLVRKGALTTESFGRKYLYRAGVRRHDCVRKASRSFLERVFGGQAAPALLHLITNSQLSPEERMEIRAILDSKCTDTEERGNV